MNYPYVLTDLAEKIEGKGSYWYRAQIYLDRIKKEKGVDIKASDNRDHCATKTGELLPPLPTSIPTTCWSLCGG